MTPEESQLWIAVFAAVLGSDPQRDHEKAEEHAREAVARFRKRKP